jgi:hypothetical protein
MFARGPQRAGTVGTDSRLPSGTGAAGKNKVQACKKKMWQKCWFLKTMPYFYGVF